MSNKYTEKIMSQKFYIGGKHAVLSALNNPNREVHQIFLTKDSDNLSKYKTKIVNKSFFNKIFPNINIKHQFIAALVSPLKEKSLKEEIVNKNLSKLVILNGISDQRNIGSILRTVLALNFDGIIVEKKFFNQKNPIMIKAASGAIESLNVFSVSNIKNEIKILKKNNYWVIGMDSNSQKKISALKEIKKIAVIFGSENKGINNSVANICDEVLKIPINNKIESLNVSNAVAVTLAIINYTK